MMDSAITSLSEQVEKRFTEFVKRGVSPTEPDWPTLPDWFPNDQRFYSIVNDGSGSVRNPRLPKAS